MRSTTKYASLTTPSYTTRGKKITAPRKPLKEGERSRRLSSMSSRRQSQCFPHMKHKNVATPDSISGTYDGQRNPFITTNKYTNRLTANAAKIRTHSNARNLRSTKKGFQLVHSHHWSSSWYAVAHSRTATNTTKTSPRTAS